MQTVVLVDDHEPDVVYATIQLRRVDARIDLVALPGGQALLDWFAARSGSEAVVVLLDINMPGLDGFETLAELERWASDADQPMPAVYFLTSTSQSAHLPPRPERCSAAGWFEKPLTPEAAAHVLRATHP
jgi:CheY-like chemotaxis protein